MKQFLRLSFAMAMLLGSRIQCSVLPYLSIRSQGINDARELVGWQTQINKPYMSETNGSFSITPEYTRSFNPSFIAQTLFCDALAENCCDRTSLKIQGTKVVGRDSNALMAENFYLPTDYSSIITVEPRIENFLIDFNMYLGLDGWKEGLFFRIHAPVVYTRWDLNYDETILNDGSNAYDPGYFTDVITDTTNPVGLSRTFLLDNFTEYANDGLSIASVDGITFDPLTSARWSRCRKTLTAVADVRMQLGYNFSSCADHHVGLSFYAAAPTGNRPQGQFLFEPIVGNGKHWEVGAGLTTHKNISQSEDECCGWDVYLDANITHLCKTRQCRTFDLVDKPLSRYMLISKMAYPSSEDSNPLYGIDSITTNVDPVVLNGYTIPTFKFANELQPLANISTIPVNVSASVQADLVLKLSWTHCNFQWDVGYNFWARSCEKICKYEGPCCYDKFPSNTWALKGDAFVYGFVGTYTLSHPLAGPTAIYTDGGLPLSATESKATIFGGTNNWPSGLTANSVEAVFDGTTAPWSSNPGIDNPKLAVSYTESELPPMYSSYSIIDGRWYPVATSVEPVLISVDDLDLCGARQRGISNKLFTHLSYTWADHCGWTPFVGVGGEVEWGFKDHSSNCSDSCHNTTVCHTNHTTCNSSNSRDFALSQWGVWFKGGVSFN